MNYIRFKYRDNLHHEYNKSSMLSDELFTFFKCLIELSEDNITDNNVIFLTNVANLGPHVHDVLHGYFLHIDQNYREYTEAKLCNDEHPAIDTIMINHHIERHSITYELIYRFVGGHNYDELPF